MPKAAPASKAPKKEEVKSGQVAKLAQPNQLDQVAIENAILKKLDKENLIADSNAFAAQIGVDG